jgi:predicted nucleic acid-binding protein
VAELSLSEVLDTSACFALLENEPGAQEVEDRLLAARAGRLKLHASFVTLTEVEYIITQERSAADALQAMVKMRAWPLQWHFADEALCSEAAKVKAAHQVSFADAFVAATARRLDATLVHKDPEFEALSGVIRLHALPPKTPSTSNVS